MDPTPTLNLDLQVTPSPGEGQQLQLRPPNGKKCARLLPWTALNPKAVDKQLTTTFGAGSPFIEFFKDVYTPNEQGFCCARPPVFPLELKDTIEDIMMYRNRCGLDWSNPKISTKPDIEALNGMSKRRTCLVENFTVAHEDFGSLTFVGTVDVYGTDLDKMWEREDAETDQDHALLGPMMPNLHVEGAFGPGDRLLQVPVRCSVKNMFPNGPDGQIITNPRDPLSINYYKVLKETCDKEGYTYVGYNAADGIFDFEVPVPQPQDQDQNPAAE